MSLENRSGTIVCVTSARSSALERRLREATSVDVRSTVRSDLETTLEAVTDPDGRDGVASNALVAVVLELESPTETTAALERVRDSASRVPTIVTPPADGGSEALAAAALRGGADEYVLADDDEERIARIREAIRSGADSASGVVGEYHRILATELPDEAFVIDEHGTYLEAKVRPDVADLYTSSADDLAGQRLADVFPDDVAAQLQACIDRTLETGDVQSVEYDTKTTDGLRQYEARVVPIDERIDDRRAVVWLARDITERAERERELQTQRDQLETLIRISAVVGQVIETLVDAPSPDAIERDVCEQLVDSELYCGAWIAERTGEGTLSYRTGAGSATTYLERVSERTGSRDQLAHRAIRTGEIQTERGGSDSEGVLESLRAAAREDGVTSLLAVPISHNESTYGVLSVLTSRTEAFSEGERAGFSLLGETIGFTIMAVKNRQLLFSDTVVELEFRIDGGDTFSFDLSEEYGCTCSLEWAGTTSGGRTVQYVTIDGLDGETVLAEANKHPSIEECRLIYAGAEGCTVEMRLAESGVRTLANHGATIREVTVEDGVGTCLIEISQDADVREIAEALTVVYENTELVARREVGRSVQTAAERRDRMLDRLTDRQLTTLRLAYYSGFFEWPRESTGEEIAEAMDVSPPTMHQHLRKGLKAVLREFFETSGGTERDHGRGNGD